nr:immunoglobulin light chain junction region [Macaca mulatta]MOX51521.1 immunoglobulin light chain junction region [Macaca mulatta]MOX51555.1 immunoglobulin light chain junction region [Macaca mulatta]MOX51633.1 immunoglobulin light chain junction region [Macaca mulatta]MOX51692.1 immunoglobulin light chain junction region [Macaca mulatta]
CQQYNDMLFTF